MKAINFSHKPRACLFPSDSLSCDLLNLPDCEGMSVSLFQNFQDLANDLFCCASKFTTPDEISHPLILLQSLLTVSMSFALARDYIDTSAPQPTYSPFHEGRDSRFMISFLVLKCMDEMFHVVLCSSSTSDIGSQMSAVLAFDSWTSAPNTTCFLFWPCASKLGGKQTMSARVGVYRHRPQISAMWSSSTLALKLNTLA